MKRLLFAAAAVAALALAPVTADARGMGGHGFGGGHGGFGGHHGGMAFHGGGHHFGGHRGFGGFAGPAIGLGLIGAGLGYGAYNSYYAAPVYDYYDDGYYESPRRLCRATVFGVRCRYIY